MTQEGLAPGGESGEHLEKDAGPDQPERKEDDKGLIGKAKGKLKGS